ncbi:MAG: hypothetical protein EUB_02265 [Eubacterium sp.]|uniref:hypothetical protein n=1 Tax=Eubacterium sp. TaxID=142586 RepID=UPI003068657E
MENIVFERNYEGLLENDASYTPVLDQAIEGGFFEEYAKMMDSIPKVIVPEDKANYEYLLTRCDEFAKKHYGRISAVVDYQRWHSQIELFLPMLEFDDEEDMSLLKDIGDRAHYVNISAQPDGGFCLHIMINYFDEVMTEEDENLIRYDALMKDEKLTSMLGIPQLTPEGEAAFQKMREIFDRFDMETSMDRTTAFTTVLHRMMELDDEYQTMDYMMEQLEALLNALLEEQEGDGK